MPRPENRWLWRALAAVMILGAAALHVGYLLGRGALDLAPDEAHYWDWSRNLDWSYYSKGPLIAYLIRAGCWLFGPLSERLVGSEMLAVRLPAVACGSLLLASLYVLTVQVFGRERLAAGVVGLGVTMPAVAMGSTLMTIDAPYTCCWGWALVFGHRAVFRGSWWAWPAAGLCVALGILAKYTMVLWLPSVGLFLLTSPAHRRLLRRPGFWVTTAVAATACLPILWWNVQNDWVTFRHVGSQAGVTVTKATGPLGLRWHGPFAYLGEQFAALVGFWFVGWAIAMIHHRPWRESDAGVRYLWWMSAPMFAAFAAASLKTPTQLNWPITAYLSGLVLTAAWVAGQLRAPLPARRAWVRAGVVGGCVVGVAGVVILHHYELVRPAVGKLAKAPTEQDPAPVRRFDPTSRLRGWRVLAAEVDRARERLRAEGEEPLLAGENWMIPGELGFYCDDHPTVYCFGPAMRDRRSQYDLWRPNPLADCHEFRGRTFLLVSHGGAVPPRLAEAFDSVEELAVVRHREQGHLISIWVIRACRGFRGFPALSGERF